MDDKQFQEIVDKIAQDPTKVAFIGAAGGALANIGSKALGMGAQAGKWLGQKALGASQTTGKGIMSGVEKGLGRFGRQGTFQSAGRSGGGTFVPGHAEKFQDLSRRAGNVLGRGADTTGAIGQRRLQQAVGGTALAGGVLGAGALNSGPQQQMTRTASLEKQALPTTLTTLKLVKPEKVTQHIAEGAGLAAVIGGGTLLSKAILNRVFGNEDVAKEVNRETGKMNAKQIFKGQMLTALEPKHKLVFNTLTHEDDIISKANKKQMKSTFETMKLFAPNLAADENAARSFLREHATYDTGPNYATLKSLADAEKMILDAGGFLAIT